MHMCVCACVFLRVFVCFYLSNHFILVGKDEARQTAGQRHSYQLRRGTDLKRKETKGKCSEIGGFPISVPATKSFCLTNILVLHRTNETIPELNHG